MKIRIKCLVCGKERDVEQSEIKKGKGKYCSSECYHYDSIGKPNIKIRGENHPMKRPEISKKVSEKQKGNHNSITTEFKKGNIPWNKGKKNPSLTKRNLENNPMKNKKIAKKQSETRKRLSKEGKLLTCITKERRAKIILPVKDTTIEVKIQNFLKQLGIEYFTHQYMKEIKHGYQCDILIPSVNLVIECDGDYWHKYPIENDINNIRNKKLIKKGFKVLRI